MRSQLVNVGDSQIVYEQMIADRIKCMPPQGIDQATPTLREWEKRVPQMRQTLRDLLGFPKGVAGTQVSWEVRATVEADDYVIEKIVYESESQPRSDVPALLYIPKWMERKGRSIHKLPAMILSCGHGGSKSTFYNQIACQLFVRLGCIVLIPDPIGEEERHPSGLIGKRGHREETYLDRAMEAGRPVIGKMVLDLVRGIDLLASHPLVDPERIGCAGSSLGGTVTQFLAAVDDRLAVCINSGWIADYRELGGENGCCFRLPQLLQHMNQGEMVALGAPRCAYLVMAGRQDEICPPVGATPMVAAAARVYDLYGQRERCRLVLNENAGHQPFHISPTAVEWLITHLKVTPSWGEKEVPPLTSLGELAARYNVQIERLYNVERHHKGAVVFDLDYDIRSLEQLRVLDHKERHSGPYILVHWIDGIERDLPKSPAGDAHEEEVQLWIRGAQERRRALKKLLGLPYMFSWHRIASVPLEQLRAEAKQIDVTVDPFVGDGHVHIYSLQITEPSLTQPIGGVTALTWVPSAKTDTVIIYLPKSRDCLNPDPVKVLQWISAGHSVVILSTVAVFDDELLVGTSSTAFNVSLVFSAIDRMIAQGVGEDGTIICHGEVDDVAAWAGAIDSRIDRVEIRSKGGVEPSSMGAKRREGVVHGRARVVDHVGFWTLVFPRELDVSPSLLTEEERTQLRLLEGSFFV